MNAFERKVKIIKELIRFNKNPVFFISALYLCCFGYIKRRAIRNFTKVLGHKINLFYADIC